MSFAQPFGIFLSPILNQILFERQMIESNAIVIVKNNHVRKLGFNRVSQIFDR
jgi:hypothetical protein